MSIGTIPGLVIAVVFILPGYLADITMATTSDKPRADSAAERLTVSLLLSLIMLLAVEGIAFTVTDERFGGWLATPMLADPANGLDALGARYAAFALGGPALLASGRWLLTRPKLERHWAARTGWTFDGRSLDRAVQYARRPTGSDSPYVRCHTSNGDFEGYLTWYGGIGNDPDPGYVLRDAGSQTVRWVALRDVTAIEYLESPPRAVGPQQ